MAYILKHIQDSRQGIINDLLHEIRDMQCNDVAVDITPLQNEIDNLNRKKRKAIDLMLDDLISKTDLKEQTAFYDSEIARLTEEINESKNINGIYEQQVNKIKAYITDVNKTADIAADDTIIYGEMLDRFIIHMIMR